jgi:hypothetical protein
MTTPPQSITQRHNGIVEALKNLRDVPLSFITEISSDVPTVIADVTSLTGLENYLKTLNKGVTRKLDELAMMIKKPSYTPLGTYLKACKAYIDKFTNQDTLHRLDTNHERAVDLDQLNMSVTTFYERYNGKLTPPISKDDIGRYALARFEIIAKHIFMLLYYREPDGLNGGKSRSSKKRTTRRRPRRKSTKRLRRRRRRTLRK